MAKIFRITGSPTLATWPNHDKLPDYVKIMKATKEKLGVDTNFIQSKMEETWEGVLSDDAYDAVRRMLAFDPSKRITASQAMKLPFLTRGVAVLMKSCCTQRRFLHFFNTGAAITSGK